MKLHLPACLRSAIFACFSIVSTLTATFASGTVAGGLLYAACASRAYAAYNAETATFSGTDNANIDPTSDTYSGVKLLTFNMGTSGTGNYLNQASWIYAGNIQIGAEGATATGLCLNNGHKNQTDIFTGKVTGTGLFSKTGAGTNLVIAFVGDVTEFAGDICLGSKADFTLRFGNGGAPVSGATKEHGVSGTGDITFTGSTYDTLVYNYSSASPVYITNAISATGSASAQVQLNGGADYVLTKDASITQLTLADNTVLHIGTEGKSSATVLGGLTMGEGAAVHVDNGSLELLGAESLVGTYSIGAEGTLYLSRTTALDGALSIADGGTLLLGNMADFQFSSGGLVAPQAGMNGFASVSGKLNILTGDAAMLQALEGAKVICEGRESLLGADGSVAVSNISYSNYYLRQGEASLDSIVAEADGHLHQVEMTAGTKINVESGDVQGQFRFEEDHTLRASGPDALMSGTTHAERLKVADTLIVGQDSTLNIGSTAADNAGNIDIQAGGHLVFAATEPTEMTVGNIVNNGDQRNDFERTVLVGEGVVLHADSLVNSWGLKSVTVNGEMHIDGQLAFSTGSNRTSPGSNLLSGSGSVTVGSLMVGNISRYNTIDVQSLHVLGDANVGCNTTISGGTTTIDGNLTMETTQTAASAPTLTVAGGQMVLGSELTDTASLNKTLVVSAGSLTLNGTTDMSGTLTHTGGDVTNNGLMTVSGTLNMSKAWENGNGTMEFAEGAVLNLSGMDDFDHIYRYSAGENGFMESHTLTVFLGGNISAGENAQVTIGETSGTLLQNGTVQLALSEDSTSVYHVNAGEAVYGGASGHIDTERVSEIALHGGNLSLQADLAEGQRLSLSAAGKVTLADGVTLTSSAVSGAQHLTLDGSGTYAAGTLQELSEVSYSDTWQGWTHMTSRSESAKGEISHKGNLLFRVEGIGSKSGGAIYATNSLSLEGNGDIIFRENCTNGSYVYGGAIYNSSAFTLNNNGNVSFIGNRSYEQLYGGGAISNGGSRYASFSLSGNGDVLFSGNSSMADGGAIYNDRTQSFTISGNESVSFMGNIARGDGGAIYNYSSTFEISGNGDVTFSGNRAQAMYMNAGGAIYNKSGSTFTLSGNGNVLFRKNYHSHLLSISSSGTLNLSATAGKSILFMDSIHASGTVNLNQEGTGDIIFTGISTVEDLREILNAAPEADRILKSRTSEIYANAVLYGGRLMVEDEAVLKVDGLSVAESASVVVKSGTLALSNGNATITTATGAEKAVLTGASLGESSLAGADAEHRGTVNGARIDLAEGANFTMQHLVLGATARITDDPATLELDDVTAELELGVNATLRAEEVLQAGTTLVQNGAAEVTLTPGADATVLHYEATSFDSVTLSGSSLVLELGGVDVEMFNGANFIAISFTSGTGEAIFDSTLPVTLSVNGLCSEPGYTVQGADKATTMYFLAGKELAEATPEPSTTTLSLLALAALAARRKRK